MRSGMGQRILEAGPADAHDAGFWGLPVSKIIAGSWGLCRGCLTRTVENALQDGVEHFGGDAGSWRLWQALSKMRSGMGS